VCFDPEQGKVWATDENAQSLGGNDRIGILRIEDKTWEYIYLPATYTTLILQQGTFLAMDSVNRVAYVQAGTAGGLRGTLIYSLDSLALLFNTFTDLTHGQSNYHFIVGHDSTNNRVLLAGDITLRCYSATNGIPVTLVDDVSGSVGNRYMITDASGKWWGHDASSPANMQKVSLSGSVLNNSAVDLGADGMESMLMCYDSTNDLIYYMAGGSTGYNLDADELYKFDCVAETYTKMNVTTPYPAVSSGNHSTSLQGCTSMLMSSDNYRILLLRGGTSGGQRCFYVVDPSDGTVDFHADLPDDYSSNYYTANSTGSVGVLWSLGSYRIQEIRFTGGEQGTALNIYKPVSANALPISGTTVQVELFETGNAGVRRDNAFNIAFIDL
jgi:hypothetical protein